MNWVEETFPEQKVDVFRMIVMEEKPTDEVAEKFGIKPGNIYQIKSRILARVREQFGDIL